MAASIIDQYQDAEVKLIEGGRGDFIVKVNGEAIWNKRGPDGDFPAHEEVIKRIAALG